MKRCIVVVLDSFGVGVLPDIFPDRNEDQGANTALAIYGESLKNGGIPTLEKLGIGNALLLAHPETIEKYNFIRPNVQANVGIAELQHFGADSFAGHQELMGTNVKKPLFMKFAEKKKKLCTIFQNLKYQAKLVKGKDTTEEVLLINEAVIIADNMETDLGQVFNVSGTLDVVSFEEILTIGRIVREHVQTSRVIALGGRNVLVEQMLDALYQVDGYIGLDTPKSGLYQNDYHVIHLGYGVDETKQVVHALHQVEIPSIFVGKVADIVSNNEGMNFPGVNTTELFTTFFQLVSQHHQAFFCLNIQETDLAGHAEDLQRYVERIQLCDQKLGQLLELLDEDDLLIVMADHGNDPTIGHSHHTREYVPLLIHYGNKKGKKIGTRKTMADVGATVAEYFDTSIPYGNSFLSLLQDKK